MSLLRPRVPVPWYNGAAPFLAGERPTGPAMPEDEPNPNLLLWSEEMQQATWSKTSCTATADAGADPLSGATADEVVFAATGVLAQTAFAATTGATVFLNHTLSSGWVRYSLTGTFDGTAYVLSVWINEPSGSNSELRLQMHRVGGVVVCSLRNTGDDPTVLVWGWKLETPDLTAYVKREGT